MVGPCPCGVYLCHGGHQCCSAMLPWSVAPPPSSHLYTPYDDTADYSSSSDVTFYSNYNSSSSPSVDCTLSLGTPATRRTSVVDPDAHQERRRSSFCGWDFLQTKHSSSNSSKKSSHRSGNSSGNGGSGGGGDPLLARRCTNCDTTSTPLWRNGPRGPKSLCNACGIRYKKEERRATAAAATNAAVGGGGGMGLESHVAAAGYYNGSWSQYQPEKVQYYLHVHDFTH